MKTKNYFIIALLAAATAFCSYGLAAAQAIEALRGKVALEAQIEERLRAMLSSYLHTQDVSVAAKVNIQVRKAEGDKEGGVRKWDEKEELILPGVPAATSMTKDAAAVKAADAARKQVRLGVASVNIWIIVGKPVPKDQQAKIIKLVSDALDLDTTAGDTVTIESTPPAKTSLAINITSAVALICLAVLAVFLYGPFRGFLKRLNENLASLAAAGGKAVEVKGGGGGEITLAGGGDEGGAETTMTGALNIAGGGGAASVLTVDSGENMPLDKYVTKDNVDDLMLILHDESPEVIAKVVQRIPQKLAFTAIPRYKMKEVLEQYLKREFVEPEKIKDLLNRIKDKMAGSFGGEARLGNLMQVMDKKSQESTLALLREKDATFAAAVETRYFKFEDLLRYDETAIRRVFRKAGAEAFARCLKSCDNPTAEAFSEALGPAIRDLVAARMQNMLMTGDNNDSELTILNAVNALAAKGLILPLADVKQVKVG